MSLPFAEYWYYWGGQSQEMFFWFYGMFVEEWSALLPILDFMGEHQHIHYVLLGFILYFLTKVIIRKANGQATSHYTFRAHGACLLTLISSYLLMAGIVWFMKEYIDMPRPYIALPDTVSLLYGITHEHDAMRSFPSGHMAFTTLWVILLWSQVVWWMRLPLLCILALMCWFRMAIGAHFPMDLIVSMMIVQAVVAVCSRVALKIFKVQRLL